MMGSIFGAEGSHQHILPAVKVSPVQGGESGILPREQHMISWFDPVRGSLRSTRNMRLMRNTSMCEEEHQGAW